MLEIDAEFDEKQGVFVTALVGVSKPDEALLIRDGATVPSRETVRLLIDTGSCGTSIDQSVLASIGIRESGWEELVSASRKKEVRNTYDVSLWLPDRHGALWVVSRGMKVMESYLAEHGFQGILGRNVLARGLLLFDGLNKTARLKLQLPREP